MVRNTHTFEQWETFDGQLPDETIKVREVRDHTIVWDYQVNSETISRNTHEKERCRIFIQSGIWKEAT